MKKRRIRLNAVIFAMILLLSGCGPSLHEMTDDEENLIVQYAAYVVAKYNITQTDGMNGTAIQEKEEKKPPVSSEPDSEQPNISDSQTDNPKGGQNSNNSNKVVPSGSISLADAIDARSLQVKYKGFKISSSYNEDKVYSLTADEGKKYVVMDFSISNPGDKEKVLDTYSKNYNFYASFNGGQSVEAEQTFLTYSLSTFMGKIKPGKTIDVVLLFQVSEKEADSINSASLMIKKGDSTYSVGL